MIVMEYIDGVSLKTALESVITTEDKISLLKTCRSAVECHLPTIFGFLQKTSNNALLLIRDGDTISMYHKSNESVGPYLKCLNQTRERYITPRSWGSNMVDTKIMMTRHEANEQCN